jgi:hypothetical protein
MKDVGVVLFGKVPASRMKKMFPGEHVRGDDQDAEAPRRVVVNREPCKECAEWMEKGVILISHDPKLSKGDDAHRTGGWIVVREEVVRRMFSPESVVEDVLAKRVAFVDDEAWDKIGFPRGEVPAAEEGETA